MGTQWAKTYRPWLGRISITSSHMGKFRERFMASLIRGGWTKTCFPGSFLPISSNMLFLVDHYCFSLMAIPPTLLLNWSIHLQKMMSSFFAYLHTPQLIVNAWISLSLVLWSLTGHKHAVTTCLPVLAVCHQISVFKSRKVWSNTVSVDNICAGFRKWECSSSLQRQF